MKDEDGDCGGDGMTAVVLVVVMLLLLLMMMMVMVRVARRLPHVCNTRKLRNIC